MFPANTSKNAQGHCQPNKDSICYNLTLHTHDEDHFHHPQIEEKVLSQESKEKSQQRQSSRLRNQAQKDYKTFIPQPKILKKVEF